MCACVSVRLCEHAHFFVDMLIQEVQANKKVRKIYACVTFVNVRVLMFMSFTVYFLISFQLREDPNGWTVGFPELLILLWPVNCWKLLLDMTDMCVLKWILTKFILCYTLLYSFNIFQNVCENVPKRHPTGSWRPAPSTGRAPSWSDRRAGSSPTLQTS